MPVLSNSKHEKFAQGIAKGLKVTAAYVYAGYSKAGASQNGARLITNEQVSARIHELQETFSAAVIALEISSRNERVKVLQAQLDSMLAVQRGRMTMYADDPHGCTGQMAKDYRGKDADRPIWKFDAALVAQIANVLKQAAIEIGQWSEKREVAIEGGILGLTIEFVDPADPTAPPSETT